MQALFVLHEKYINFWCSKIACVRWFYFNYGEANVLVLSQWLRPVLKRSKCIATIPKAQTSFTEKRIIATIPKAQNNFDPMLTCNLILILISISILISVLKLNSSETEPRG